MINYLAFGKRGIHSKAWRLLLFLVVLMPVFLLPQHALAQTEEKAELTLQLRDGQYNLIDHVSAYTDGDNKFFLEVRNTGTKPITNIKLSVEGPEGWIITISPAEINSLSAGSLNAVDVNIRPVGKATNQSYYVTFVAQSSEIASVKSLVYVGVSVNRTQYSRTELTLSLTDGQNNYYYYYTNNEIRAGVDNKFVLEVRNTGTELLTNIKLSSEAPEGWSIEIKPAEISYLGTGQSSRVDVNIRPVGKATKERQEVILTAQASEIQNVKSSFFVTVKPAQFWIWIWIVIGVAVVVVFVLIYMRFGRQ